MRTIVITAVLSVVAGTSGIWLAFDRGWLPLQPLRAPVKVIDQVKKVSLAEAESHRASRFAEIRTIEETLALPGDFAQTEALYALAGRSDSAAAQDLIFQANGISDSTHRKAALDILFSRLTELDPESALALSRSRYFASDRDIEASVWQSWATIDLDQALAVVASLASAVERRLAAEALFAAYGFWGNDQTAYIAETLGMEPGESTRARYLHLLADRDPAVAIEYINSLKDTTQQRQAASLLGRHLGKHEPQQAERFAALLDDASSRRAYRGAVVSEIAAVEPMTVLDTLLGGRPTQEDLGQAHGAMQALAAEDIDRALAYLTSVTNPMQQKLLASAVAQQLARDDPERALVWAKEQDGSMQRGVYMQVLSAIAGEDPDLAIEEALRIPNAMYRRQVLNVVVMTMSHHDPQRAVAVLDKIDAGSERASVAEMIARNWMRTDPDAAIDWVLKSDVPGKDQMMSEAAQMLAQMDAHKAMSWLPRIDEKHRATWRAAIAKNLAAQQSFLEAQNFIAQYQNAEDYPGLLAAAISGVAHSDPNAAFRLIELVPGGSDRNALYSGLIERQAYEDPQQAATWLTTLTDTSRRAHLAGQIAAVWSRNDPAAAERWALDLPRGDERDYAIAQIASNWDEMSASRRTLIDSISDTRMRRQAVVSHIYQVAGGDPRKAEALARDFNLPENETRQLLDNIAQMRSHQMLISPF